MPVDQEGGVQGRQHRQRAPGCDTTTRCRGPGDSSPPAPAAGRRHSPARPAHARPPTATVCTPAHRTNNCSWDSSAPRLAPRRNRAAGKVRPYFRTAGSRPRVRSSHPGPTSNTAAATARSLPRARPPGHRVRDGRGAAGDQQRQAGQRQRADPPARAAADQFGQVVRAGPINNYRPAQRHPGRGAEQGSHAPAQGGGRSEPPCRPRRHTGCQQRQDQQALEADKAHKRLPLARPAELGEAHDVANGFPSHREADEEPRSQADGSRPRPHQPTSFGRRASRSPTHAGANPNQSSKTEKPAT